METMGEWIPGDVPPDEEYWQALLRDGENGKAVPAPDQKGSLDTQGTAISEDPSGGAEGNWRTAAELMEQGEPLELPVVDCNHGGVVVAWNGLRGFVPASHLDSLSGLADDRERFEELRSLIGTRLQVKIIEMDPERRRLVLSERASRQDERERQELLNELTPGDVRQGCVTNICSFGAFVDLGGLEGLVHISEISWGRVEQAGDVLEPGEMVDVYVLNVDRERGRVGLSIKRLQPDPWHLVEERYAVGQVVDAVICHVVDFGAFARVEEGLEGLIHVSELADGEVFHPRDIVREGDAVRTRILNIDSERRRMGLSLRPADEPSGVEPLPADH